MMRSLISLAGCLLIPSMATAEGPWRYAKPVELAPLEAEELVAVPFDSDVYRATRPGHPDVRVLTDAGKEVAFLTRRQTAQVARKFKQSWPAEEISLRPLEDGGLEITFRIDLKKHPEQPEGIRLLTRLQNFEHHVRIESSADGDTWHPLVADGLIFDYSQFMDVRNLAIELPAAATEHRGWMRLTIEDVTKEQQSQLLELSRNLTGDQETSRTERLTINRQPFRIERIELWHDAMRVDVVSDARVEYPLGMQQISEDPETHETRITLASNREPLTRFTLETADRNFSRTARVEVRRKDGEAESWQTIGSGRLSRLDFRSLQRESLTIDIPAHRETDYRLVIENRDSPPLKVSRVLAEGNVDEVVFFAQPTGNYRLAYGSDTLDAPRMDTAALTAALAEGFAPLSATLGPAVESEVAPPPAEPLLKRLLNNGPLVTAIIAGLVVMLAAGLIRATRNLDQVDQAGDDQAG